MQGSYLSGGVGELPAGEMVRVWVADEDVRHALELIAEAGTARPLQDETDPRLVVSWQRAWSGIGAAGDGLALRDRLLRAWIEPQRKYHTLQHLLEALDVLVPRLPATVHPGEVELALWFHDAVYDLSARDNEARSADWAATELRAAGVAAASVDRVHALVMATRHAAAPATPDEALLVDADLAILGADTHRFDEYEVQVRQEYAWVPGPVFRRNRRKVLADFLARPSIYTTDELRSALQARARANIVRSLARLRPWYRFWGDAPADGRS